MPPVSGVVAVNIERIPNLKYWKDEDPQRLASHMNKNWIAEIHTENEHSVEQIERKLEMGLI